MRLLTYFVAAIMSTGSSVDIAGQVLKNSKKQCPETSPRVEGFTFFYFTTMVGARGGGGGVAGELGKVEENAKTSRMVGSLTTIT
jgi:hypothetical protein